ncbi:hypothetical protein LNQ81_14960 [Myroides sp. M-43]|uniref:hypothetical protein n=1 Tax=Myroides oncorhynchi TaxID=2893756 RepID=UPI001E3E8954|nr:hypothetical protein [Myroides oncorhynchi]MCC9043974.1 hypothetical protein [Myroides oncorhynchi]
MIKFNKEIQQLEISDNYKGRLSSSRIMALAILVLGAVRLYTANWQQPNEMDYVFCIIVAMFLYISVKNFLIKTSIEKIDKYNIKYVKMPKGLATKAVVKLNNRKTRDIFGLKTADAKNKFRKVLTDAKIKVLN